MDTFWAVAITGGAILYFLNKNLTSGISEEQDNPRITLPDAELKTSRKRNMPLSQKKVVKETIKKSSTKASTKKTTSSVSLSRSTSWKPTYDGPMFAQPGEKSALFSYASFSEAHEIDAPFSLIDFETSGFHPDNARILEVAVIKINAKGKVLDEFTTLINPGDGYVGRTDIHKITLKMVKNAPTLSEALGDLIAILNSSIVVAHNAKFEERFLESAFREMGLKHPPMPTIDTLWLSRQVLDLPNYKLSTVIDGFGYDFQDAHTALGDVRAMAKVMPEMLKLGKGITFPSQLRKSPPFKATGKSLPRDSNV